MKANILSFVKFTISFGIEYFLIVFKFILIPLLLIIIYFLFLIEI